MGYLPQKYPRSLLLVIGNYGVGIAGLAFLRSGRNDKNCSDSVKPVKFSKLENNFLLTRQHEKELSLNWFNLPTDVDRLEFTQFRVFYSRAFFLAAFAFVIDEYEISLSLCFYPYTIYLSIYLSVRILTVST